MAAAGPAEHVNEKRDVLYVVVRLGDAERGRPGTSSPGEATIVDKGCRRALAAGPDGVRYLTAHIRRGGLEIKRL